MTLIGNIQSVTSGVDGLLNKIKALHHEVNTTGTDLNKTINQARGMLSFGGAKGLGDSGKGNLLAGSMGSFSTPVAAAHGMMGATAMAAVRSGGTTAIGMGMAQMAMAPFSAAYAATQDSSAVINRAGSYYQSALRSPGMNRLGLERATFKALNGGMTGVGSDAAVANILTNAGYMPRSQDYLATVRQVGGAANYLGMKNENAASAIAGLQSGGMGAQLYQYGINTIDAKGNSLSVGNIAKQIYGVMFPNGATPQSIASSMKNGYLGQNLQGLGMNADQQQMMMQAFTDISAGKNPDLGAAKSAKGNDNPFDPMYKMNKSETSIQMSSERSTINGLKMAATTVQAFNDSMRGLIDTMAVFKGYMDGLSGTKGGQGVKKGASSFIKGAKTVAGGLLIAGGLLTGNPLAVAGGVGVLATGGGTPGMGGSFGGRGSRGGGTPGSSGLISAQYGDLDSSIWAKTGGKHLGTDYTVDIGTSVVATKDGVVSSAVLNPDYGQAVQIDHPDGYSTVYAHLSNKLVSPGTRVSQGQEIGKSGKSGNTTGPGLHYEVRHGTNNPVDPSEMQGGIPPVGAGMSGGTSGALAQQAALRNGLLGGSSSASGGGLNISTPSGSLAKDALSDDTLRNVLVGAGFSGSSLETAIKVVRAESGGRAGALNPNAGTGDYSMGLFQINMIGDLGVARNKKYLDQYAKYGYTGPESLYDPAVNARIAYDISKSGTKWSDAWVNTSQKLGIGGGTPGSGGSFAPASSTSSGTKIVNFNVYLNDVSEAQALLWAKRVASIIEDKKEDVSMGA